MLPLDLRIPVGSYGTFCGRRISSIKRLMVMPEHGVHAMGKLRPDKSAVLDTRGWTMQKILLSPALSAYSELLELWIGLALRGIFTI